MKFIPIFSVTFFLVLANKKNCVINLTKQSFNSNIRNDRGIWFVKFFTTWCKDSKKLQPIWVQLADKYCNHKSIHIAEVNA